MGQLERIFLFTMTLFAMFIFFLFGLYFDLGDFLEGGVSQRRGALGIAQFGETLDQFERASRSPSRRRGLGFTNAYFGVPDSPEGIAALYDYLAAPQSLEARLETVRSTLRRSGFTHTAFIEMAAWATELSEVRELEAEALELSREGNYDAAVRRLLEALEGLPEEHLIGRRELLVRLIRIHFGNGGLEAAEQASRTLHEVLERIVGLREAVGLAGAGLAAELGSQREANEIHFAELRARLAHSGRPDGPTEEEASDVKAKILSHGIPADPEQAREVRAILEALEGSDR